MFKLYESFRIQRNSKTTTREVYVLTNITNHNTGCH